MKSYPSIPARHDPEYRCHYHVFDKIDGSNIRAEWSAKRGFSKFGTRTRLLGTDQPVLYPAIEKFMGKYADELSRRFKEAGYERAMAFVEYAGPSSFAGSHPDAVSDMDVVLFDIAVHRKGLLAPDDFLRLAEGLQTAKLLKIGYVDDELIQQWIFWSTWPLNPEQTGHLASKAHSYGASSRACPSGG